MLAPEFDSRIMQADRDQIIADKRTSSNKVSLICGPECDGDLRRKSFEQHQNVMQQQSGADREREVNKEEPSTLDTAVEQCTTAVGPSYVAWRTDVNLGRPSTDSSSSEDAAVIGHHYSALQRALYETGYPETEDRTHDPRRNVGKDRVTVTVLSSPAQCMGVLLEGGVQCPGDMLLVLSPSWLSRKRSPLGADQEGSPLGADRCSQLVHKAVTFERGGRSYIDVYEPPRRTTYFINLWSTRAATNGERDDGEKLEADLNCPMSGSLALSRLVEDTLWTRIKLAEAGLTYPASLAFTLRPTLTYDTEASDIHVVSLDTKIDVEKLVYDKIEKFVTSPMMQKHDMIVVKPCGVKHRGGLGVTYHARSDVRAIWTAALQMLAQLGQGGAQGGHGDAQLGEGGALLLEAFLDTMAPRSGGADPGYKWGAGEGHAARVRAIVVRGPDDRPCLTKIVCGVGLKKSPLTDDDTIPQSLDTTLLSFNIADPAQRQSLRAQIRAASETLMQCVTVHEGRMTDAERGGEGAQTDLIGVDFILSEVQGKVVPVCIGTRSHGCTASCQLHEFMHADTKGDAFREYVQTMIARSQRFVMRGKTVMVVGAGSYAKGFVWPGAKDYGVKVVLVDHDADHFAVKLVKHFLLYDFTDHTQDELHAHNIIQLLRNGNLAVDGCISIWEDCGPLAARISEVLGLGGPGLSGALAAKKKSATQGILAEKTEKTAQWPWAVLYSSKSHHIGCGADIDEAHVDFPCVMKLEFGSSAVGVSLVHDVAQCRREWAAVQEELREERSHPGVGLGHGNTMLLMDYVGGTEHDVDVILHKRRLIGAFVSDNGPTRLPKFTETAAAMPSFLPDELRDQLVVAAHQCCVEVGLVTGVFNVELKLTAAGPRLIEINARMGGFYLRDWIRAIYGVDTLLCALMLACDVTPLLPPPRPRCHIVGVMVVPSAHRAAMSDPGNLDLLGQLERKLIVRINRLEAELPPEEEDRYEEPYMSIAVVDSNGEVAKRRISEICRLLGLNTEEYPVDEFLKDFKRS